MNLKQIQRRWRRVDDRPTDRSPRHKYILRIAPLLAVGCLAFMPDVAAAAPWDSVGNKILQIFTGGLARTIAIIAVIALGISAFAGKLSWNWAINIVIGIVLVFGATGIIDYIISAAS